MLTLSMHSASAQGYAGGTADLSTFFTNVLNLLTGKVGQSLAILAVALGGIGALVGVASLRFFGGIVLGVGILFSSAWIVNQIVGS